MNPICPKCGTRATEFFQCAEDALSCTCAKCGNFILKKKTGVMFVITRTSDAYGKAPVMRELTLEDILTLAGTKPYPVLKIKHRSLQVQDAMPEIEIVDAYD